MATHRLRAVFLVLVLALVLTTTACRGTTSGRSGHSGRSSLHLPWFSTSHEPDPIESTVAELGRFPDFPALDPREPPREVWDPPLSGLLHVTRPFQPPRTRYAAGHRGVDLGSFPDAPVMAAGSGTVAWAGVLAGRGVVVVSHGALRTTYEPVVAAVQRGQGVVAGQEIGALQPGHLGCPVAACLHWGLLRGTEYLDPMSLLADDVRLLPLGSK